MPMVDRASKSRRTVAARLPALPWIALGLLVGGVVFIAGGGLLIMGAIRRRTG